MIKNNETTQRSCITCVSKHVCKIHLDALEFFNNKHSGYFSDREFSDKVPGSFLDVWASIAGVCTQYTGIDRSPSATTNRVCNLEDLGLFNTVLIATGSTSEVSDDYNQVFFSGSPGDAIAYNLLPGPEINPDSILWTNLRLGQEFVGLVKYPGYFRGKPFAMKLNRTQKIYASKGDRSLVFAEEVNLEPFEQD